MHASLEDYAINELQANFKPMEHGKNWLTG
jgi:hypothetical protein